LIALRVLSPIIVVIARNNPPILLLVKPIVRNNPRTPLLVKPSHPNFLIMAKYICPWPTVRRAGLAVATGLSEEYIRTDLKTTLTEGLYWFRLPNSVRILWNLNLVRDWLVNGNTPAHARAIEKYIASLPSSDVA
jgi:hypothetical protein